MVKLITMRRVTLFLFSLLFAISAVLPTASGVTFPDIDGVKQGRAPYLVALWTVNPETHQRDELYCSGVLIDPYHFLTAAHCLDIDQSYIAVGGITNISERGQTLLVTDSILHPRYDAKTFQNDIAIARLYYGVDGAAEWGAFIGKYPTIPKSDKSLRKDMRLFGWGMKQNKRPSNVVTSIRQNDFNLEAKKTFKFFNEATMLGAGFRYKTENLYGGACYGDSGGPLVANESTSPKLIGLVSYGSAKGCDVQKPTVYTRVSYYKSWIEKSKSQMLEAWRVKGIKVGSSPSIFSLPVFSSRFLEITRGKYSPYSYVALSTDPDTGRADINGMMLQMYQDGTLGINLYFTKTLDGCLFGQKGTIQLQVATNSYQDIDFEANLASGNSCLQNNVSFTTYDVSTPPNNFSGSCEVTVNPWQDSAKTYYSETDIGVISMFWDSRCLGRVQQIWARVLVRVNDGKNEADIEPGTDMWVGPLNPKP
jgi:hypothetical protein